MSFVTIPGGSFEESSHIYKNSFGLIVPSVTQVFEILGMNDFGSIPAAVLERKSTIGVAVHAAFQYLCEGTLDWDSVGDEIIPYAVAAESWIKGQNFISLSQEVKGIHKIGGMEYGFTYDNLGTLMYKGRLRHAILDLKTTVSISPTCMLQTAAYALAAPPLPNGEKYLRCVLQVNKNGGFRPFYYENRNDELTWQQALYIVVWGLNEGLYSLEKAA